MSADPICDDKRAGQLLDIATALRKAAAVEPAMHIIRRADGSEVNDEYGFVTCDGPDDWQAAEDNEHHLYDEEVDYEILACPSTSRRTTGTRTGGSPARPTRRRSMSSNSASGWTRCRSRRR